jgi:hypothetical protein
MGEQIMIDLTHILQQEPTLTPNGIESSITGDLFDEDYINQIYTCIGWLKTKKTRKTINRKIRSYGIKHIIERELDTYVCNGSFIAAVIHLGIPYKRINNSPNIHVAIGLKELYKNDPNRG